jgi:hypothetical protein
MNSPPILFQDKIFTLFALPKQGNRKPKQGNRKPKQGNRKPKQGNRKLKQGNRKPFNPNVVASQYLYGAPK